MVGVLLFIVAKTKKLLCNYKIKYYENVITMSIRKNKTDQYQLRLQHELRSQLEEEMKKDGDTSLATWIKRVLRKELRERGIEPKG